MAKERLSTIRESCDSHAEMTGHKNVKLIKKRKNYECSCTNCLRDCGFKLGDISVSNTKILNETAEELLDFVQLHKNIKSNR
jgi:hypothetical protein